VTTDKELDLLKAIYNSDYHDGRDPLGSSVWVHHGLARSFPHPATSLPGVMASLSRKGHVFTDGVICYLTESGVSIVQESAKCCS
jgi:hypothetical protein